MADPAVSTAFPLRLPAIGQGGATHAERSAWMLTYKCQHTMSLSIIFLNRSFLSSD